MTTLMKLFSALFGYDYDTVVRQPTFSRQKVVTLGLLILIPVVLWAFSGFYLAHELLGLGYVGSGLVAATLGGIILILDRSFVSTPKSDRGAMLKVLRFGFAVFSTFLGSLALDLALFQGDITEYRRILLSDAKTMAEEEYKARHGQELSRLERLLPELRAKEAGLGAAHIDEMTGKRGTGQYGKGKVSDAIERQKISTGTEVVRVEEAMKLERESLEKASREFAEEKLVKRQDALISQLKDLHGFVFSDGYALAIYLFFFGFVAMLELFFIMYKTATSDTIFEEYLVAEEQYVREKLKAYQRRKAQLAREYGVLGEDYAQVTRILGDSGMRKIV